MATATATARHRGRESVTEDRTARNSDLEQDEQETKDDNAMVSGTQDAMVLL